MTQSVIAANGGSIGYGGRIAPRRRGHSRVLALLVVGMVALSGGAVGALLSQTTTSGRQIPPEMATPSPFSLFPH